jgi:GTP-binding protein
LDFRFQKTFRAKPGEKGGVASKYGRAGEDLIVKVPVGTQVWWLDRQIADLDREGEQILIAKGGLGGRGNQALKTKGDRLPHWAEPGKDGETKTLRLELKLLADVGLVGLPNAGKSTLLGRLTAAQPKIGAYPFTTLEPNLGVMTWKGRTVVLADIPGLIEGASQGKGLGHDFLRHVERTKVLVHLTDSLANYQIIRAELAGYSPDLLKKKEIVALSKTDTLSPAEQKKSLSELRSKRLKPLALSAATGDGLDELRNKIIENL